MPTPNDLLLGRLAVQRGLITDEQARECLELLRQGRAVGYDETLSAVFARRGLIDEAARRGLEDDLARLVFLRGEQLFARRCVERGLVERDEARALLAELRDGGHRTRLGELLVERGRLDRVQRDAIAREVVRLQDDEERAAREADRGAAPAPPPPPPPPAEDAPTEAPAVQPRALASFDRDQRRFSQSGEWLGQALPALEGFEVEQRLGQGPNGVVYRARVAASGERVALKVLAPGLVSAPGFVAGLKRAWALAQRVDHPAFVRPRAVGRAGDLVYLTTDLVDGESLQTAVERSGPLPAERALALVRVVLQGLERAHAAGAAHGALCPDNVLLSRLGAPVVTDLALAGLGQPAQGAAGLFASPQRLAGGAPPAPADDIYALGCVAYFATVGRAPFPDASPALRLAGGALDPRDVDPAVDGRLAALVERATRPSPPSARTRRRRWRSSTPRGRACRCRPVRPRRPPRRRLPRRARAPRCPPRPSPPARPRRPSPRSTRR
ncbi:MAG: serine/threonine protein kinase [Planctomycetes bacterium]|nr:serine/threonine protein kinase [Planctomycetota bacterium]